MTLIINKRVGGRIRSAISREANGGWYFLVTREYEDGLVTDEWVPLPNWKHGIVYIPNIGGDLDEAYLKDIIESHYGRKAAQRLDRPNVTTLYHEFNEARALEFKHPGKTQFAITKESPRGNGN